MKTILICLVALALAAVPSGPAAGWGHANRYGGSTSHSYGSTSHTSAWGTSTSHTYGEGTSHTNVYGGSASHAYGGGWSKTGAYGGTAYGNAHYGGAYYHPPGAYPAYHPPATVNYYGSGCYNCGGWSTAGAAAAGAAVGLVTGAAIASSNTAAATSSAYSAGVAAGSANTSAAYSAGVAAGSAGGIYHGRDLWHAARRLRRTQHPGHNLLPVRQHLVQAVLRRQRRLLCRGAYALTGHWQKTAASLDRESLLVKSAFFYCFYRVIRIFPGLLLERSARGFSYRSPLEKSPLTPLYRNGKITFCGLFLNKLITNAFKHAFPAGRKGELRGIQPFLSCDSNRFARGRGRNKHDVL